MRGLKVNNLWFKYPGCKDYVLRGLDMEVMPGEIVLVVGRNGSGKSTLLKILAGILEPCKGEVLIDGSKASEVSGVLTGMAFQDPMHQFSFPTVIEEVSIPLRIRSKDTNEERGLSPLGRLGLGELARRSPHSLSFGEARLLTIAAAIAGGPRLILLDEPFTGIDPREAILIAETVREIASSGSIVVATSLTAAHRIAERLLKPTQCYVLQDGRLSNL